MRIIQTANYERLSQTAALLILNALLEKPQFVLGLATGHTPSGLYRALVEAQREMELDLSQMHCFHLDEYIGLGPQDPESMAAYLCEHLLNPLGLAESQCHFVPATAADPASAGAAYDAELAAAGGIDLQILGIGSNGHIAFNEPGTPFDLGTHVAALSEATRTANARYFASGETPAQALSMGPRSILQARQIVLLAAGESKAEAVRQMLLDPVSEDCPASVLRFHPDVTLILDHAAAAGLPFPLPAPQVLPLEVYARTRELLPRQPFKVLVAAPHPDDASIGCGGTLSRLRSAGAELHFVSMTSGHRADIPDTTREERVVLRAQEGANEARAFGGAFTPLNLPFYEHHYIPGTPDLAAMDALLEAVQPDWIFSTSPQDRHPAHRASALIVSEAVQVYARRRQLPTELWFYEGPWYLFERDDFNTVVELTASDLWLKLQGVAAHVSQVGRKRYDLAAKALAEFRAITVPESRLSSFGSDVQDLGSHVEVFRRLALRSADALP
ncbi:MAG: 6-phosphogluconolactonase [Candidatus Sericytochromatia bacterium]